MEFKDFCEANIQVDIWIDEEEYQKVYETLAKYLTIKNDKNDFTESVNDFFNDFFRDKNEGKEIQNKFEKKLKFKNYEEINENYKNLFFAKCFRAFIQKTGTDDYIKYLENLVIFLQKNLPYSNPYKNDELILQTLYFHELAACAKPGLQSLGFALQAEDILLKELPEGEEKNINKLWAYLNKAIGYYHSGQMKEALPWFDKIIRGFNENGDHVKEERFNKNERCLLKDQAILLRAEVLEKLQFSYHTMETVKMLKGGETTEYKLKRKLIKEALAYRDMDRLNEAKDKITGFLKLNKDETNNDSIEELFKHFNNDKYFGRNGRNGIKSQFFEMLIDYYLEKFKTDFELKLNIGNNSEKLKKETKDKIKKFLKEINEFETIIIKPEQYNKNLFDCKDKMGFYQQLARYLEILVNKISELQKLEYGLNKDAFVINSIEKIKGYIKEIYNSYRDYFISEEPPEDNKNSKNNKKYFKLKRFEEYEYDRYTKSLEKFYENINLNKDIKLDIKNTIIDDEIS